MPEWLLNAGNCHWFSTHWRLSSPESEMLMSELFCKVNAEAYS